MGAGIASDALALVGAEYRYGGATPDAGFDCSGLTRFVMAKHGVTLPRTVADQFQAGNAVNRDDLEAGDLVFFSTLGRGPTHVGIVTDPGSGEFVHAPADGSRVRVDVLGASYWRTRWVGARRIF
jgi:cell wall-associated NlpC family hydrolase